MLKYISPDGAGDRASPLLTSRGPYGLVVSGVVFGETSVGHSGTYRCEPGAAPAAKVLVHVIDGKRVRERGEKPSAAFIQILGNQESISLSYVLPESREKRIHFYHGTNRLVMN